MTHLYIFLKLHVLVPQFLVLNFCFSMSSPFYCITTSAYPSNCKHCPSSSAPCFMSPAILVLMGCMGRVGNREFNSPHFKELPQEVPIFFPGSKSCFASYQMPAKLQLHINLVECRGVHVPCSGSITLC